MSQLIGPFSQVITFADTPLKGALGESQMQILHDGAVVVDNGVITQVGEFDQLRKTQDGDIKEIDREAILIPGLIDCHTHMIWGGSRRADFERRNSGMTYQQILNEGGGILDTVNKTRNASRDELKKSFVSRVNRHLADGITTLEVKSGYGLDKENELKMLQVANESMTAVDADIITTFLGAHVCPTDFTKEDYLDYLLNEIARPGLLNGLTQRVDAFVEQEAFPAGITKPYLAQLKELGFNVTVHADQFSSAGARMAVELGALSADHLESTNDEDVAYLANSSTVAVALPGASLGLGMQFTPARKLLDAGAALAIATDWNPGSAPNGDLLMQGGLLATYEKLTAAEVLAGITFRSAAALGLQDRGRIKSGLKADLCAFETDDYRDILYHQGRLKPSMVWKNGELR